MIVQLPEDQVEIQKQYLRHLLIRVSRILDRMTFELRQSMAPTAGDVVPADARAFVLVGGRKKRRRMYGGGGGVDDVGDRGTHLRVILKTHQDVMTELTCLLIEFVTKY